MDPKIEEAIEEAVREEGQSKALARKLAAWFDAVASGNEDLNDRQSANRHLELVYEETQVSGESDDSDKGKPSEVFQNDESSE